MKTKLLLLIQLILLILNADVFSSAFAQNQPTVLNAPRPTVWKEFSNKTKHPTDWLTWGADIRVRDEFMPATVTLNNNDPLSDQNVIRFRGRVWASAKPFKNLSINTRLSGEPRYFTDRAGFSAFGPGAVAPGFEPRDGMQWRYGIVDLLNLKCDNIAGRPLTLTLGRQDILLGDFYDWWLVADGTPNDGSWTLFLDSARLTFDAEDIRTKFELIYLYQNAMPDEWMPTLGKPRYSDSPRFPGYDYWLTEQNEQGLIFYLSNKSIKNTTLDAYFIYKHDDQQGFTKPGNQTPGDNADIYTIGGKITGTSGEHIQYSLEGAYQFGKKEDYLYYYDAADRFKNRDIEAYGAKAKLSYLRNDAQNHQFYLVGEVLSGDDPDSTGKDEMFDILWGRWPRWSELYISSYAAETSGKGAQMNNLLRFGPGWTFNPIKDMIFSVTYNAMFALENTPTRRVPTSAATYFSYDGHFRGHYFQTFLKYKFNSNWSGHLWAEFVREGNYYNQHDTMIFLRPEILFTF